MLKQILEVLSPESTGAPSQIMIEMFCISKGEVFEAFASISRGEGVNVGLKFIKGTPFDLANILVCVLCFVFVFATLLLVVVCASFVVCVWYAVCLFS